MASQLTTASGKEHKCGYGRCPIRHKTALTQRFVTGCDKMVHTSCFNFLCLTKNSLNHFSDKHPEAVVCGKRHYDATVKMINQSSIPIQNQNIAWNKDGKNGPDDRDNSEHFIVSVMTHKTNVNLPQKNVNKRIKSNTETSSACNRVKIARNIRWKDRSNQVNPRLNKSEGSREP